LGDDDDGADADRRSLGFRFSTALDLVSRGGLVRGDRYVGPGDFSRIGDGCGLCIPSRCTARGQISPGRHNDVGRRVDHGGVDAAVVDAAMRVWQ